MACEPAAYMLRELYSFYYSCAIKTSNNQMIRSYPVGNCVVPWQDNWKNIQWKLQPTEISTWRGNCWCCWARHSSPGSHSPRSCPAPCQPPPKATSVGPPLKQGGENPRTSYPCVLTQFYLSHAASSIHETFNSRFPATGSRPLTGYAKCIFTAVGLPTAELSEK